jgi:hypothetical protein
VGGIWRKGEVMAAGDEILAMIKEVKEQQPVKRTECPVCECPLEEHPQKGLHCPFCGWTEH